MTAEAFQLVREKLSIEDIQIQIVPFSLTTVFAVCY